MHASIPDSDQALRIYQGLEQWKGRAIAGTPESLRSEAATGMPSAGRGWPSPRARRLRSGPLASLLPRRRVAASGASRFVVAGINPAFTGRDPVPVLRRHARSLALVRRAPSLRQRRRIHRARTLLLFAGHDRERGQHAESGRDGRRVGSVRDRVYRYRRGAYALRSPRSCALELATHSAAGIVSGTGSGQPVFAGAAGTGDFAAHVLGGASPAACRARDLGHGNRSRTGAAVCRLLL